MNINKTFGNKRSWLFSPPQKTKKRTLDSNPHVFKLATCLSDHPSTRVIGAWVADSRRQKSRNPESYRGGKRSRVEFRSAQLWGFSSPAMYVVTPIIIRDWRPYPILLNISLVPPHLRRCATVSQTTNNIPRTSLDTSTNQHSPFL